MKTTELGRTGMEISRVGFGAVAVAWTLRDPAVDAAITGYRRPDQVEPILAAADLELDDEEAAELEAS